MNALDDDRLIIHVFGETDFTSLSIHREAFDGLPKIFGTSEGSDYVQVLGTLFGEDSWDQLQGKTARNGMTFDELVARSLVHLAAGTDTLNFALQTGHNLVALGVFRGVPEDDNKTIYNARFFGSSQTATTDPTEHHVFVRNSMPYSAPFVLDDIEKGLFAPDSLIATMVRQSGHGNHEIEEQGDPEQAIELSPSVFFHEMVTQDGLETVIICACDPDLANVYGALDTLTVGLVSGVVPTPHGSVGYWLWQIAPDTPHAYLQEQFVSLHDFPSATYDRMKASEMVRLLVIDRTTHENTRAILLNGASMGLVEFEEMAKEIAAAEPEGDFQAACQHVMDTVEPGDFLAQTRAHEKTGKSNLH